MSNPSSAPFTSAQFDKAYNMPITFWDDYRIPQELKDLLTSKHPKTSLELGCGLGRFSSFMSSEGVKATGVDFSSVAIEKAKKRTANNPQQPIFLVGDVTNLSQLTEPFDVAFDIGCFHCLDADGQQKYVAELHRLLKPNSTLLIWAMDHSPSDIPLSPAYIKQVFGGHFHLANTKFSRRRIIASHWYWLERL